MSTVGGMDKSDSRPESFGNYYSVNSSENSAILSTSTRVTVRVWEGYMFFQQEKHEV